MVARRGAVAETVAGSGPGCRAQSFQGPVGHAKFAAHLGASSAEQFLR